MSSDLPQRAQWTKINVAPLGLYSFFLSLPTSSDVGSIIPRRWRWIQPGSDVLAILKFAHHAIAWFRTSASPLFRSQIGLARRATPRGLSTDLAGNLLRRC